MKCEGCKRNKVLLDVIFGEYYWTACGLVNGQVFDYSPLFKEGERVYESTSMMLPNKGLGTISAYSFRGSVNGLYTDNIERNFDRSALALASVSGSLGPPRNVRESIALFYRTCIKKELTRGRDTYITAFAAASIVCKSCNIKRNLQSVAIDFGLTVDTINSCVSAINLAFGKDERAEKINMFVQEGLVKINAKKSLRKLAARETEAAISKKLYSGKNPAVFAAAMLAKAAESSKVKISRKEIAKQLSVSDRNIRRLIGQLKE
jgi:transcription initiation factor TFIIB